MDAGKFRRLRNAILTDENPIIDSFREMGVAAKRNTNIATQRSCGDVVLTFTDSTLRSVESQVATYTNFSYTKHKIKEYIGPGKPEHAYVMLGCKKDTSGTEMFYLMCQAQFLHLYLEENITSLLSPDGKYFIIPPGNLIDLGGCVACGDSIKEVVQEFCRGGLP